MFAAHNLNISDSQRYTVGTYIYKFYILLCQLQQAWKARRGHNISAQIQFIIVPLITNFRKILYIKPAARYYTARVWCLVVELSSSNDWGVFVSWRQLCQCRFFCSLRFICILKFCGNSEFIYFSTFFFRFPFLLSSALSYIRT